MRHGKVSTEELIANNVI